MWNKRTMIVLVGALAATRVPVIGIEPEAVTLERAFLELTS